MPDVDKVLFGAGVFSIGDWVTAGGAGSLTDVGHTAGPIEMQIAREDVEVDSEQVIGSMRRVPTGIKYTIKVPMKEGDLENMRIALGEPAGSLTGVAPDETLVVGSPIEQYHQATIVTKGIGTTGVRTITLWKLYPESIDPIPHAKGAPQMVSVTFHALHDESLATGDKVFKAVDA